jgi:hypothetical protein
MFIYTVASIPKLACFSHQTSSLKFLNCNFSSLISTLPLNHQPVIQLTIHLTHELSLQSTSTWYPYLNLIAQPEHTQPQLIHLQVNHIPEIQSWLQGTEIEQLLNNGLIISFSQLQNIHNSFNLAYPWSLFLKAFIIVSSRAFQIDNFHQLALVPIADLFDHSDQPDVEMISEDLVCDQCGASQECIHDSEDLQAQPSKSPPENNEDTVELVSIHPLVLPVINQLQSTHLDTEDEDIISTSPIVYNTYGKLSNARLLAEYGFMIDGNSYDRIHFDYHQVSNKHNFDQVQALLNTLVACNLFKNHTQDELIAPLSNEDNSAKLFIDSNARLSPHLWLAIIIKTYNLNNCIPSSEYITHLLQLQDFVSSHECLPSPSELEIFSATIKHLFRISQCIQQLCYNKLARYHLPDASVDELLTIKEVCFLLLFLTFIASSINDTNTFWLLVTSSIESDGPRKFRRHKYHRKKRKRNLRDGYRLCML